MQIKRATLLVWQSSPRWTVASVFLSLVQGIIPLSSLYLMKLLVDAIASGSQSAEREEAFQVVAYIVAFLGAIALLESLLSSVATLVKDEQTQAVTDYMQGIVHSKAIEADLEYYENTEYYDTLHRAQQEAPYRPNRIVQGLVQLGQSTVLVLGVAGLLITLHWGMLPVLLFAMIPGVWVRYTHTREMFNWRKKLASREREAEYYNVLLTVPYSAKELKLFNLGSLFQNRYKKVRHDIRRGKFQINRRRCLRELATQGIVLLPIYGALAFIAYRATYGAITVGSLVMLYQAFQRGQVALQAVLNSLLSLHEDNLFLSSLYDFLDLKPKVVEPAQPQAFPQPIKEGIVFENVEFKYEKSERQALRGINLCIKPGQVIALVGENGSGKTTLVKLLCRLYDPQIGRITIDGVDIRDFATAALRREISVVFQDYLQYHMTARENIWLGDVQLPPEHERVTQAAKLSGAHEVIASLSNGYETHLGKFLQEGEELSIGQWQKIAIARAFVRDAQLIVLDEPTSALDAHAEAEVFAKFRQLVEGRSAVLISHRMSTVKMADHIYVMHDGEIVEHGTHDDLLFGNGTYAALFETQAQSYR